MNFIDSAACGDLDTVKELLQDGKTSKEEINGVDKDGRSALHYACLNDDIALLKLLLADDRVDVGLRSPKGDTCMHMGALYASLRALKLLFEDERGKALINTKNDWGETPLHLCAGSGDKGAGKAALLLLENGASLTETDKWDRGPRDVSKDNAENPLVKVFEEYLDKAGPEVRKAVDKVSAECLEKNKRPEIGAGKQKETAKLIFAGLGGALKSLKKTEVKEKTMFSKTAGKVTDKKATGGNDAKSKGKILSKLIDFPGDIEEIKKFLADSSIDPGGKDAYGLTALMKFASWNKTDLIDLIIPHLTEEQLNAQDPDGKTAVHWACEMASVGSIQRFVADKRIKTDIKDAKGRTPMDVLNSGDGAIVERLKKALIS